MRKFLYFIIILCLFGYRVKAGKWYVDDGGNAGDVYTAASLAGSNANPGTILAPFATVNYALTQAQPFDTIYVDAGTYAEQVILTKSCYMFGAGSNLTQFNGANKSASGGTGFTINKNVVCDIRYLSVLQYNLGISHVSSNNTDTLYTRFVKCDISDNFSNGLRFFGSARLRRFVMDTCTMTNNNGTTISRAVFVLGPENDSVFVRHSVFTGNPFVGVDFNTPPANRTNKYVSVVSNTITGCAQPGLALNGFLSGLVEGNTVTDCGFAALEIKTCLGNGASSGPGSFVIQRNLVSRTVPSFDRRDICGIGIINRDANIAGASGSLSTQGIVVVENEISNYTILNTPVTGGAFTASDVAAWAAAPYNGQVPDTLFDAIGVVIEGSGHKVLNNKFTNCEIGLLVQQLPVFSGTTAPISDFFDANRVYTVSTTSVDARFNGYFACPLTIRTINMLPGSIDASNSFFGAFTASGIAATVRAFNSPALLPFPAINPHLTAFNAFTPTGAIDFSPWVKNPGDPSAIGYQGDYTALIVDNESPNVGPRPYVQEGHDNVSGGVVLSVQIEPGLYTERNVVSKNVHYLGVNSPTIHVLQMNGVGDTLYVDGTFALRDSLYCTNGVITTQSLSSVLLKETCVSDQGTATSFVNGPIWAERLSAGNYTLQLPVGKAGTGNRYMVLSLTQTNPVLTTYTVEYFPAGAPTLAINPPVAPTWIPQSYWSIEDGGVSNFSNPHLTLFYGANDYLPASAHTIVKRVTSPAVAWDYIKDLSPSFTASSGTVASSVSQNAKFTAMGVFALAPLNECPDALFSVIPALCAGDTLKPVNTSSVAASNFVSSYTWHFGDGSAPVVQMGPFSAPFPASNPLPPPHVYTVAGTYTVKLVATANAGCKDSLSLPVVVYALPSASVSPSGTLGLCPGFSLTASLNGTANYTWAAVPALSVTATSTLAVSAPGMYFALLTDANGCKNRSDTLVVNASVCRDLLGISKKTEQQFNLGGGVFEVVYRIKAKNYGTSPLLNIQLNEPLQQVFPAPTDYTVSGLSVISGNFIADASFNGSTNTNLIAAPGNSLAVNDSSILELKIRVKPLNQITFKNQVTGVGTGSFATVTDVSYAGDLADPDGNGVPDESSTTDVNLIADFMMPGGFSPDADNVNDVLIIQGIEQYPDNDIQVFNRWGNLVYKKHSYTNSEAWDARPNAGGLLMPGSKVPAGTYFYVLKLTANDKPLTGYLTIKY